MNQSISSIFTLVLLLQGLVYFWAWVEKRLKPVLHEISIDRARCTHFARNRNEVFKARTTCS